MNSYRKQALYNTLGNTVYLFCLWILTVLIVRISGYEDAGIFSVAMSVANIFFIINLFGMRSYQVSDVHNQFSSDCYIASRYFTIASGALLCASYLLIIDCEQTLFITVLLFLTYRSFESMSDVYYGELQKCNRLDICFYSMSGKGIISVMFFSCIYYFTHNLQLALLSMCIVALAFVVLYDRSSYLRIVPKHTNTVSRKAVMDLLLKNLPLFLTTLFPVVLTAVVRLEIQKHFNDYYSGIFSSVSTPTVIIITLVPNILIPFISLYALCYQRHDYKKIMKMYLLSLLSVSILCFVGCFFVYLFGKPIMAFVFGEEIRNYTYLLSPLIIATSLYALTMCGNAVLITIRKTWQVMIFSFVSLVACTVLAPIFIDEFGLSGAAKTMIFAYVLHFVLQLIFIVSFLCKYRKSA